MEVTWADVEYTETPGEFIFEGVPVQVEAKHIKWWKEDPGRTFGVKEYGNFPSRRYLLVPK